MYTLLYGLAYSATFVRRDTVVGLDYTDKKTEK